MANVQDLRFLLDAIVRMTTETDIGLTGSLRTLPLLPGERCAYEIRAGLVHFRIVAMGEEESAT